MHTTRRTLMKIRVKIKVSILLSLVFLQFNCDGILQLGKTFNSGDPLWVKTNTLNSIKTRMTCISIWNNDVFIVGSMDSNSMDFGNNIIANGKEISPNDFILRQNQNGTLISAVCPNIFKSNANKINSLFATSENLYAAGGMLELTLSKLDLHGTAIWISLYTYPNPDFSDLVEIAVQDNNIFAIGSFTGKVPPNTLDFGNSIQVTSPSWSTPFVINYNNDGIPLWVNSVMPGSFSGTCYGVADFKSLAVVNEGIYVCGSISDSSSIGGNTINFGNSVILSAPAKQSTIIAKYNQNGFAQWAKTIISGDDESGFNKIRLKNNYMYCAGWIFGNGNFYFDDYVMARGPDPNTNCVLVKYDLNGNARWARSLIYGGSSGFSGMAVTDDAIYVCGSVRGFGLASFGHGVTLEATESTNPVLVKYDLDGTAIWAKTITPQTSGMKAAKFNDVAADGEGAYVVGSIGKGTYKIGTRGKIQGSADENYLIIKYMK
jgi:hypothetical protein